MPLTGLPLTVEPTYPKAAELASIGRTPPYEPWEGEKPLAPRQIINRWHSDSKRATVVIYEQDGKRGWGLVQDRVHHFGLDLTCLGASDAWGIEQEARAANLLGTLVSHRQFKHYMLTAMFLERSARSGLTYVFRRLRPTVVLDTHDQTSEKETRILCALCMHPIAYYEGSWAGAMTPTDDVVAHLMLMRGDEHMFWKRSNQHPPWKPEAGL